MSYADIDIYFYWYFSLRTQENCDSNANKAHIPLSTLLYFRLFKILNNVNVSTGFVSYLLRVGLDEYRVGWFCGDLRGNQPEEEQSSCLFLLFTCYKSILFTMTHLGSQKLSFKRWFYGKYFATRVVWFLKWKLSSIDLFLLMLCSLWLTPSSFHCFPYPDCSSCACLTFMEQRRKKRMKKAARKKVRKRKKRSHRWNWPWCPTMEASTESE